MKPKASKTDEETPTLAASSTASTPNKGSSRATPTAASSVNTTTSHNNNSQSPVYRLSSSLHNSVGGVGGTSAKRLYRAEDNKWVTRDIAALGFLRGIPLEAEQTIVGTGLQLHQQNEPDGIVPRGGAEALLEPPTIGKSSTGNWWETISGADATGVDEAQLDQPLVRQSSALRLGNATNHSQATSTARTLPPANVPGRRLEGDEATLVQIPLRTKTTLTVHKTIAREAAIRDWELSTAHGLRDKPALLDGRLFFSAGGAYPLSVFSLIRYEPRKEEAAQRRQKLEARGGGGTTYVMPARDWRGNSYRVLLPRHNRDSKAFNRFLFPRTKKKHTSTIVGEDGVLGDSDVDSTNSESSSSSNSSEDSDQYVPGLLDDPDMILGRHRNVMIGDKVTGPIVASTIQFVKPVLLKEELNKQFRERFDGWEPPRSARKFIGARVVDGEYRLMDPSSTPLDDDDQSSLGGRRSRQGSVTSSVTSVEGGGDKVLRMPPSLTLSKIRALKQQALAEAVKAKLQISTVALACVYFERLCLDCRVDKSNRRLSFAACMLLASKLNEPHVSLRTKLEEPSDQDDRKDNMALRLKSFVKPNKRSKTMFARLLEFFTQDWNLNVKSLFDAEWGVFAALGFQLHVPPSHVAFHFRRLLKTLDWSPRMYLGDVMFDQWQDALDAEETRRLERARRHERRRRRKEGMLLNMHIKLENEAIRQRQTTEGQEAPSEDLPTPSVILVDERRSGEDASQLPRKGASGLVAASRKAGKMKLFQRFGLRRSVSTESIHNVAQQQQQQQQQEQLPPVLDRRPILQHSPSMPTLPSVGTTSGGASGMVAIDIPYNDASEASSFGSIEGDDEMFV